MCVTYVVKYMFWNINSIKKITNFIFIVKNVAKLAIELMFVNAVETYLLIIKIKQ